MLCLLKQLNLERRKRKAQLMVAYEVRLKCNYTILSDRNVGRYELKLKHKLSKLSNLQITIKIISIKNFTYNKASYWKI